MIRHSLPAALATIPLLLLAPTAGASLIYSMDQVSSPTIGSGVLGAVTLTQNGPDEVDVSVTLSPDTAFVSTGGPRHSAAFNLDLVTPYTVAVSLGLANWFTVGGGGSNAPYGAFTNVIDCTGCGSGSSSTYNGALTFSITDFSGVTIDDFIANDGGFYFSSDVIGPAGTTGNIASTDTFAVSQSQTAGNPIPEPDSIALFPGGIAALIWLRLRCRVVSRDPVS